MEIKFILWLYKKKKNLFKNISDKSTTGHWLFSISISIKPPEDLYKKFTVIY